MQLCNLQFVWLLALQLVSTISFAEAGSQVLFGASVLNVCWLWFAGPPA
jgi:hypothetical protein